MRYQGQLIEWHDDQGYGFIQPLDQKQGEQKIFLHIKSFARRGPRPLAGVMLEYEITQDDKGRLNAQQVSYVRRKQRASGKAATVAPNQHWRSWLIIVYLVFILALQMTQQLPVWAIAIPLVLSGLTYLIYNVDKQAAQQGRQRIPEKNLHLLALLGGWPGALLAQQTLRHKSAKVKFQQVFWATVSLNWILLFIISLPIIRHLWY